MTRIGLNDDDIIYGLYKLSSVVLPEKNTWSIDEVVSHLAGDGSSLEKTRIVTGQLKNILNNLEEKQAIIFVNGFDGFNLVEPKLLEVVSDIKSSKTT